MKNKIFITLLCMVMLFTAVPFSFADTVEDASAIEQPAVQEPEIADPAASQEPALETFEQVDQEGMEPEDNIAPAQDSTEEEPADVKDETPAIPSEAVKVKSEKDVIEQNVEEPANAEQEITPISSTTVNFTNAAPFMPPIKGKAVTARMVKAPAAFRSQDKPEKENKGVELRKSASIDENENTTITLDTWVTGDSVISETHIPTDIVMVLDQSGSMKEPFGSSTYAYDSYPYNTTNSTYYSNSDNLWYKVGEEYVKVNLTRSLGWSGYTYTYSAQINGINQTIATSSGRNGIPNIALYSRRKVADPPTKLEALKEAARAFANNVHDDAVDNSVDHTISVVGFGSCNLDSSYYTNSELFVGGTQYRYDQISNANYRAAPQVMNTLQGYNNINASINNLAADGATYIDLGLDMAENVFNKNPIPSGEQRNRVIVVFTDGAPGYNGTYSGAGYGHQGDAQAVVNVTLPIATRLKNDGVTVYSIGIFEGADASSPGNANGSAVQRANYFMHHLSSNNGTVPSGGQAGYYLSASDSENLKNIFESISSQIGGASTQLGVETIVKDIISDSFTLPENADASSIKLYTQEFDGFDASNNEIWKPRNVLAGGSVVLSQDRKSISVKGFDFSENWVGNTVNPDGSVTPHGKKLVIEFVTLPDPNFLGGQNVTTNNPNSGLYDGDGNLIENFQIPTVNVKAKPIIPTAGSQNVYYLHPDADSLIHSLDPDGKIDGTNNAYVTITYEIKKGNTSIANVTVPKGVALSTILTDTLNSTITDNSFGKDDESYTVLCRIKRDDFDVNNPDTYADANTTANVYVFKPEITFNDSTKYYGEQVASSANEFDTFMNSHKSGNAIWRNAALNKTDTDSGVVMTGEKPELVLSYGYNSNYFTSDWKIDVANDIPVTAKIKDGSTDITSATKINGISVGESGFNDPAFTIHVKSCKLTINKSFADGTTAGPNQAFIFDVTGPKGTVRVKVIGAGSVTIGSLPIGDYTVKEDSKWSWRFTPTNAEQQAALTADAGGDSKALDFVNAKSNNNWLDGNAFANNIFNPDLVVN